MATMHGDLRAHLLGQTRIVVDGRAITEDAWHRRASRSLFLLLLSAPGHRLHRERAIDLLWPDLAPAVAGNALAKALHGLRRTLEPDLLDGPGSTFVAGDGETIVLRASVDTWVDVDAFEAAAALALATPPAARRARLREAVSLYGGEFLRDEPPGEWLLARREALHRTWSAAALALAEQDLAAGEPAATLPTLQELLDADPIDEAAHRALMRAFAAAGRQGDALRQYRRCTEAIGRELGLMPDEATQALAAAIAPASPVAFPAPSATPFARRTNLPALPTPLVGREHDIAEIQALLWRRDVRLVTVLGPGGVGKTCLAIVGAAGMVDDFPDGVWFVDLSPLRDATLILPTIVRALGLQNDGRQPLPDFVRDILGDRRLLLVLDNVEHLPAGTVVAWLLAQAAGVHILATGREPLRLRGEHEFVLSPLAVVEAEAAVSARAVAHTSAAQLFVERARAVRRDFTMTDANAAAVAEICRRLDGLPLAIELAAARCRELSTEALLARLAQPFAVLTSGTRDLPERQRTLRATVAWSYDLLPVDEQAVFRRLAVFVGGCALDAVGAIRAEAIDPSPDPESSDLELVAALVDKSLLRWEADGLTRLRMLETLRDFGLERLAEAGELAAAQDAHARHFLALAEVAAPELTGAGQAAWLDRLDLEYGNLRAAIRWMLVHHPVAALRLGAAIWPFWQIRGHLAEGEMWLRDALAQSVTASPAERTGALIGLGVLTRLLGDVTRAIAAFDAALALCRKVGDRRGEAEALDHLGRTAYEAGDYNRAVAHCGAALALAQLLGEKALVARALRNLAAVALWRGDFADAASLHADALALLREVGAPRELSSVLDHMGILAQHVGEHARAIALFEESLKNSRALGDMRSVAVSLINLGRASLIQGDAARAAAVGLESLQVMRQVGNVRGAAYALTILAEAEWALGNETRAAALLPEVFSLVRQVGDKAGLTDCLEYVAGIAVIQGDAVPASRLLGAAEASQERHGAVRPSHNQAAYDRHLAAVRAALDGPTLAAAWAAGRALTLDQALAEVTFVVTSLAARGQHPGRARGQAGASRREIEVLRLLADGRVDREIAATLAVSPRTVTTHVSAILARLGAATRAAAVATALRHNLI